MRQTRGSHLRHNFAALVTISAAAAAFMQPSRANAQVAPPTACDGAASFAFDPQRVAPGVGYDAINAPFAIPQCAQAVRLYPDSGRLHFEFGRALEKAGRLPRAIAAYGRAAQLRHGGGYNNLGELYRAGKGVPRDLSMAQQEFEQGAALGYPEAQYNLANMLLRQGRTDANVERARQLLTSALNAGYVDASASLRALPSKASPMPWSTRGWSVPATGTAVPTPEQRATPAPALVAQTSPPTANPVLAKVFVPKMLDIQVPYLETIVGPAMRLTKLQHDLELRTYQVGDCELLAYAKGSTVSAYGLRLKAGCAADLSQFIQQPVSVTADATFGGLADTLGGGNGTYQSACIYECGNVADPRVEWTWEGSNAQNRIKVELAVTLVAPDSLNAATAWQNAMLSRESQQYVASAHFNCDGKYQQQASSAFRSVRVTELFFGHGESMDDQDVAMACPLSGEASNTGSAGVSPPIASNVGTVPPQTAPIATAATATTPSSKPPADFTYGQASADFITSAIPSHRYSFCSGYVGRAEGLLEEAAELVPLLGEKGKILTGISQSLALAVAQLKPAGISTEEYASEITPILNAGAHAAEADHKSFKLGLSGKMKVGETQLFKTLVQCAQQTQSASATTNSDNVTADGQATGASASNEGTEQTLATPPHVTDEATAQAAAPSQNTYEPYGPFDLKSKQACSEEVKNRVSRLPSDSDPYDPNNTRTKKMQFYTDAGLLRDHDFFAGREYRVLNFSLATFQGGIYVDQTSISLYCVLNPDGTVFRLETEISR